jgi:hypothetical protein
MAEHTEQQRLLVHDTVATTVDTIVAAIQAEMVRAQAHLGEEGQTRLGKKWSEGFMEGLRAAESAAVVASVAARSAAMHTRPADEAAA